MASETHSNKCPAPIKHVADSLSLPVHELDTFTGWTLPEPSHATTCINLIIAVSFGLFVPPRILRPARYGGLNVHPSLLPESVLPHPRIHLWGFTDIFTTHSFRGAAPLHHTLLAGRPKTGVTVQTLHPARFDHGVVLAQTPYPGFDVSEHCTVSELRDLCAPAGAQLLVQTLRGRLFVPPLQDVGWFCGDPDADGAKFPLAPKITPEDRHVRWDAWTADVIITRERVLGGIWAVAGSSDSPSLGRRVVMHGFREVRDATPWSITVGRFYLAGQDDSPSLRVGTCDGKALEIQELTIEGKPRMSAARAAKHAHLLGVAWQ